MSKRERERERERERKYAYPKKVCHMLRHVKKNRIKDAYPKKVCHMLGHVKKREKEKIAPYPKKERWYIQRSSYTIYQKYPHTCTS